MSCIHHYGIRQRIVQHPKNIPCASPNQSSLPLKFLPAAILFISIVLLLQNCHKNKIIQHAAFSIQFEHQCFYSGVMVKCVNCCWVVNKYRRVTSISIAQAWSRSSQQQSWNYWLLFLFSVSVTQEWEEDCNIRLQRREILPWSRAVEKERPNLKDPQIIKDQYITC